MAKPKQRPKFSKADMKIMNQKIPGIYHPPNRGPGQIRGGKRSFARVLTSPNDPTKPSEGGQQ